MKELSIEQKAKRYDELKVKAQELTEDGYIDKLALLDLFPELKENEDERIRKELICYFEKYPSIVIGPFNTKECIAWLEKQGEQKSDTQHSTEWGVSDFRTWQYIVSDVLTKKDGIGQYLDSGECKKIAKYMQEEWSKKLNIEQKHTELLKGEDYGIDGLYHAIDILERTLGKVSGYQSDDGILEHKAAITAVKKLYKQKPVELEKEEKSRLMKKCVHRAYQQGYDTGFFMATTEFEHKQEWSEEDEGWLDNAIVSCEQCGNTDTADWLKSFRPQKQYSQNDEHEIAVLE